MCTKDMRDGCLMYSCSNALSSQIISIFKTEPCGSYAFLSVLKTRMRIDCLTRKLRQLFIHVTTPGLGVTGLLLFSLLVKLIFSLSATYSESAYPNTPSISVLCNPLIRTISAAE